MHYNYRKGASIFISAVLLVVITVGIGLLYAHWYSGLVKEKVDESEESIKTADYCSNIAINFENVTFNITAENVTTMYLENVGEEDAYITKAKVYNIKGYAYEANMSMYLEKGDKKYFDFKVNTPYPIEEIKIILKDCGSISIPAEYIQQ